MNKYVIIITGEYPDTYIKYIAAYFARICSKYMVYKNVPYVDYTPKVYAILIPYEISSAILIYNA